MYTYKSIKSITKFSLIDMLYGSFTTNSNIRLSSLFWSTILSLDFFQKFVEQKYIPFKREKESEESFTFFLEEYRFLCSHLPQTFRALDIKENNACINGSDTFFIFRIFTQVLSYYNEYYHESYFSISLSGGISCHKVPNSFDDFFDVLDSISHSDNLFINDIIVPLIDTIGIKNDENKVYKFEIFWPDELLLVAIITKLFRTIHPDIKIVLDFSDANEQYDFTQWGKLIQYSGESFFQHFDFFIVNRDFGKGMHDILEYLNSGGKNPPMNVIYYDAGVQFHDMPSDELSEEMFTRFIDHTYRPQALFRIFGKNAFFGRFLPYKCYWNNCSFCAINSNNKFTYDRTYGYDFFIDKWVDFIEKNSIFSINFKDEAIPPSVIIKFAKKIIARKISLNYQFRTRYDELYTKENCQILGLSGARYVGIGLESAVDRVNQEIGNKGNNGVGLDGKMKIIRYFEMAGVSIHNYCIFGFPGETDEEIGTTFSFLTSHIKKTNYFTCTPNIFALMKGPHIFSEREKYGVEIEEKEIQNPFNLSYDFCVYGKPRSMELLYGYQKEIHRTQFLPWLSSENTTVHPTRFWDFIDRSFLFYLMKRFHPLNPYYRYMKVNDSLSPFQKIDIMDTYFVLSPYIQYSFQSNFVYINNWVECHYLKVHTSFFPFFDSYDSSQSLQENMKGFPVLDISFIQELIKKRFLIHKNRYETSYF